MQQDVCSLARERTRGVRCLGKGGSRGHFHAQAMWYVDVRSMSIHEGTTHATKQFDRVLVIQLAIGGHPPIPTGSSCPFLVQHVLLYFFVIVGSTLLGMFESLHIF